MHPHCARGVALNTERPPTVKRQHVIEVGRVRLMAAHTGKRSAGSRILVIGTDRMQVLLLFLLVTVDAQLVDLDVAEVRDVIRVQLVTCRTPLFNRTVHRCSIELAAIVARQTRFLLRIAGKEALMSNVRRVTIQTNVNGPSVGTGMPTLVSQLEPLVVVVAIRTHQVGFDNRARRLMARVTFTLLVGVMLIWVEERTPRLFRAVRIVTTRARAPLQWHDRVGRGHLCRRQTMTRNAKCLLAHDEQVILRRRMSFVASRAITFCERIVLRRM